MEINEISLYVREFTIKDHTQESVIQDHSKHMSYRKLCLTKININRNPALRAKINKNKNELIQMTRFSTGKILIFQTEPLLAI